MAYFAQGSQNMIQQGSMPPVSANVLAALVGSLQLPPAPIVSAPGAAPLPSAFSTLQLGMAQNAQTFSEMLVGQLASAIARSAAPTPLAGGTAPPQAASPPLWAATAPPPPAGRGAANGLADAGESPGQQSQTSMDSSHEV